MKRTTIKDIAKALNVNISTVSRALKDHPDISEETKKKVKEAVYLLHYNPNSMAVNFRNNKSQLVAVIVPKISMFFIPSVLQGISDTLTKSGYKLLILSSDDNFEKEKENIEICINSFVEGILISLTHETKDLEHLSVIKHANIPLVIFDKTLNQEEFKHVIIDNVAIGRIAAQKILKHKNQKILALLGNENLHITQNRKLGLLNELQQNTDCEILCHYVRNVQEAKEIATNILRENTDITSVFAMSDEILGGINAAILSLSKKVSDYHIIAISDGNLSYILDPNIEYVIHDGYAMGQLSARTLINEINGLNFEFEKKEIHLNINS